MGNLKNAKIREIEDLSDNVRLFTFDFVGDEMRFECGQFVNLSFEDMGEKYLKPYSICSNNVYSDSFQLVIKLVEGGKVTPHLWNKKKDDEVEVRGPLGLFGFKNKLKKDKIVFVGTGTGIAPLRSMVQNLLHTQRLEKEIVLIFGAKFENDLLFREEFEKLEEEFANFKYVKVLSRDENWNGRCGHVQDNFDFIDVNNSEVYMCGLPLMVDGAREKLNMMGMSAENIYFEKY